MDNLYIPATNSSPEIDFKYSEGTLTVKGESYPENASAFFGPILSGLKGYLETHGGEPVQVNVALTYFNSSSTKILFNFFGMLNEAARAGTAIEVNWYYDEEDDTILEFGQELISDFASIRFHPISTEHGRI